MPFSQTSVDNLHSTPENFRLYANYPNPFNASTTISYSLSRSVPVTVKIYDILGREVATVVNESQEAGYHSIIWQAEDLATGSYLYSIKAGEFFETGKMLLLK